MCLSIILLLFSNIVFFVPLFVVEISHSLLELRQLAPVTAPVYLHQLAPVNTGANWRTGAETGENWSPSLAETGAKTGAILAAKLVRTGAASSSSKHPLDFQEILI